MFRYLTEATEENNKVYLHNWECKSYKIDENGGVNYNALLKTWGMADFKTSKDEFDSIEEALKYVCGVNGFKYAGKWEYDNTNKTAYSTFMTSKILNENNKEVQFDANRYRELKISELKVELERRVTAPLRADTISEYIQNSK